MQDPWTLTYISLPFLILVLTLTLPPLHPMQHGLTHFNTITLTCMIIVYRHHTTTATTAGWTLTLWPPGSSVAWESPLPVPGGGWCPTSLNHVSVTLVCGGVSACNAAIPPGCCNPVLPITYTQILYPYTNNRLLPTPGLVLFTTPIYLYSVHCVPMYHSSIICLCVCFLNLLHYGMAAPADL